MKKYILLGAALMVALGTTAQQAKWTSLFNGKNLDGWKKLGGKATYVVQNNEIIGKTVTGTPNTFLATEKDYGDFILELEYKLDQDFNSGIQFRSQSKADYQNGRVFGYQMEIDPSSRRWSGGVYEEGRRGWLYPLDLNPVAQNAYKPGQWNKYRIECKGSTIRTFINGVPAAHVIDEELPSGFIALQVHGIGNHKSDEGKTIRWRNIRIIENPGASQFSPLDDIYVVNNIPNNISAQEAKNGYRLLWDGKSSKGWRGAYKDAFPAKGWSIKDGILSVLASDGAESTNGGDIVTNEQFAAFDLEFDFKLTEGANSGVKYFVTESENNSGSAIGLEYQILDDAKHPDAKLGAVGNRTLASLYDLIPSMHFTNSHKAVGEWNHGRVVVYPDNRVEHWLNGHKVVSYVRGDNIYKALVARSKYAKWPNFGMARTGHILLQDHGNAVSFKSIKIKVL
ncbi:hypothetical protein COR50_01750 [Chitinophaga caeni]|uniref:3-keto-alpha-glucoside-1,2-lyase/3-keto-2-hydroxy-glucal hydratase domain-containing protein n=1 Tax=Chitinophaga caeni TaxID=2029983 RepID=A0A291QPY7_9BACT|nr:DUF1080 domain-containing protein [Chitinophaga caeni]ATL45987.1 hypothetical protein COR50_01750 [Chitinophaga caeni]